MAQSRSTRGPQSSTLFSQAVPLDDVLAGEDYVHVRADAARLQSRVAEGTDPAAILTAARALLETCYKHILEKLGIPYAAADDLTSMHKKTILALNLHPDRQAEDNLKRMMGGANSVVHSMASLRNSHSDSHGKGTRHVDLGLEHAEFVAHMAGGLVRLLIQASEKEISRKSYHDLSEGEKVALLKIWENVSQQHGATDPDQLAFAPAFEEIALQFTAQSGIVLPRYDIFKFLTNARKNKSLPGPTRRRDATKEAPGRKQRSLLDEEGSENG